MSYENNYFLKIQIGKFFISKDPRRAEAIETDLAHQQKLQMS
jgi:hypothetical protein